MAQQPAGRAHPHALPLRRAVAIGAALLVSGFVGAATATWWQGAGGTSEPGVGEAGSAATVEALSERLEEETRARQQLEAEVARLRDDLFEVGLLAGLGKADRKSLRRASRADGPDDEAPGEAAEEAARAAGGPSAGPAAGEPEIRPWFDQQALASLGLGDSEIEQLRRRWTEHQLERMNLSDRAAREGWRHKLRYRKAVRKLESDLVSELGVDRYDLMLYATNQPNRVIVLDVLEGSAAGQAGLQSGDRITGYAGAPVFRRSELVNEITSGEPGERVRVQVERDGRTLSLSVPRGPLGIRLRSARVAPSSG